MVKPITAFAWLRDFAIVLLIVAGFDLRSTMPHIAALMISCALVVFIERVLWSWYLLDLRDQKNTPGILKPAAIYCLLGRTRLR